MFKRVFFLVVGLSLTFVTKAQQPPHKELIKSLVNGMSVHLDNGSPFSIKDLKIRINNVSYSFENDENKIEGKVNKRYPQVTALSLIFEKNDVLIQTLSDLNDTFKGESGDYQLYLNVNPNLNSINLDGTIFILTKEAHFNRNKYNKVAKGTLTRVGLPGSSSYKDECGLLWEQSKGTYYHEPINHVKFLRKASGGGEYETIKRRIKEELPLSNPTYQGVNVTYDREIMGTYNFGETNLVSTFFGSHELFDVTPHKTDVGWGWKDYIFHPESFLCNNPQNNKSSTVFLMDTSGSMGSKGSSGKSKYEEMIESANSGISSLLNNTNQEVAFLTFAGGCSVDPLSGQTLIFSDDFQEVQKKLYSINRPGGGTPLNEAVNSATISLQNYVANYSITGKPKLIVLSDGAATCSQVRPTNVYSTGNVNGNNFINSQSKSLVKSSLNNYSGNGVEIVLDSLSNDIDITYHTIGFDIKPGSKAERDLQYLAQRTGGKYLNAQNQFELTRAFSKFFRVYKPKPKSSIQDIEITEEVKFTNAITQISNENYFDAKEVLEDFIKIHSKDYNAIFNLGLMYQANDYHKEAIKKFEEYLILQPNAKDKEWVLNEINLLKTDIDLFLNYTKKVLASDLDYLNQYFQKIQNGESLTLAEEFKGFVKEKVLYYENLTKMLGINKKSVEITAKDISRALRDCTKLIEQNPDSWDTNATPLLSMTFLNMERLILQF
jgi:tetratricopeptide (TPR) repeat protein